MLLMQKMLARLKADYLLLVLLLLLPILWWVRSVTVLEIAALVHWPTVAALAGLMLLSRALEESGYLVRIARWLCHGLPTVRWMALALIMLAAGLSALVTNDVALFILVPLTLSLGRLTDLPVRRLIIFLALAVNAGSSFTPIGNPQNLLLWQASGWSFWQFCVAMLPLSSMLLMLILLLAYLAFKKQPLVLRSVTPVKLQKRLFYPALLGYPLFILALEWGYVLPVTASLLVLYGVFFRQIVLGIDWLLLLVFALMFIDLGLVAQLPIMQQLASLLVAWPDAGYSGAALLSQLISNVPAAIFMQHFTTNWQALSWGVSVGGFGLAIGSMANLIALRLSKQPDLWREFHYWSVPIFVISLVLGWWLLP